MKETLKLPFELPRNCYQSDFFDNNMTPTVSQPSADSAKKTFEKSVVSLFSGCGGMDIGFEGGFRLHPAIAAVQKIKLHDGMLPRLGYKTVLANDIRPGARNAWESYFREDGVGKFHLGSVVDLVKSAEIGEWNFPSCDVVTGGFPCQDFSVAGKREGFESSKSDLGKFEYDKPTDQNRGMLYMWMRKVIELCKPTVFIAENVKGLVSLGDAKEIIARDFSSVDCGYHVFDPQVLRATDFGVPQSRERVIFIGFRKDRMKPDVLEKLMKGQLSSEMDPYPKALTQPPKLGDILLDLAEPEVSDDPAQRSYSGAKWYGKHCQGQTEIDLNGIGPTIRSEHHGNIEFRRLSVGNGGKYIDEERIGLKQRRLTVRECARIQTFPDEYKFIINNGTQRVSGSEAYKLIGNAVPPVMAYHIAYRLKEVWGKYFNI